LHCGFLFCYSILPFSHWPGSTVFGNTLGNCGFRLAALIDPAQFALKVLLDVTGVGSGWGRNDQAVLQALYARERSGNGRHITVSLFHALADWMNVPYLQHQYGGVTPERNGLSHPTIAPYGVYSCGDGREILFSIQNEREWHQLCSEVLYRPDLAHDPRFSSNPNRVAHRSELDAIILSVFGGLDRIDVARRLDSAAIANGCVSTMEELASHPQNRYVVAETPSGPVRMLAPGADADGQLPVYGRVPALDEHGARLREEFEPIRLSPAPRQ
jgi:crotonobetainyl-CoA:carnitine CoA-transferase CaiB-like acyl-CoA transferase